jgi:RNA polymerase sigma-70 factor (ECF subfamily)
MAERTSEELLIAVGRGDEGAFEELVRRYQLQLINFFFPLVWDRHTAEDLAQEVFVRLYTGARNYQPTARFTSYLYRIARNCWIDLHRQSKSRRLERSIEAADEATGASLGDVLSMLIEQPEETARKEEFVKGLVGAIDTLPTDHKVVFILSQVEGLRYKEISDVLDIPEGTVKSRMFACLKKIREHLKVGGRRSAAPDAADVDAADAGAGGELPGGQPDEDSGEAGPEGAGEGEDAGGGG